MYVKNKKKTEDKDRKVVKKRKNPLNNKKDWSCNICYEKLEENVDQVSEMQNIGLLSTCWCKLRRKRYICDVCTN